MYRLSLFWINKSNASFKFSYWNCCAQICSSNLKNGFSLQVEAIARYNDLKQSLKEYLGSLGSGKVVTPVSYFMKLTFFRFKFIKIWWVQFFLILGWYQGFLCQVWLQTAQGWDTQILPLTRTIWISTLKLICAYVCIKDKSLLNSDCKFQLFLKEGEKILLFAYNTTDRRIELKENFFIFKQSDVVCTIFIF